ncbi:MAG TPA: type VI secretion system baseplate subunit TssE [Steroidobacteraceae bacterium]|nr:type VI secretion system baseplate subunit TssE [Steroidobacteraceae bacterium]
MAELSLREQLQPGLLDRLTDDERFVTQIQVSAKRPELERLRIRAGDFADILAGLGLKAIPAPVPPASDDEQDFWFSAAGRSVVLQQIKEFTIKPPGAPNGVVLGTFCRVQGRALLNAQTESLDRRVFTMRRLRDAVFRDITWLLNSMSLDSTEDLARYPEVERSVINYGMPTLAGRQMSSIDPQRTAERIARAISQFEPRLSKVRVTPETRKQGEENFAVAFQVEADLWGQPVPQHLVLRTSIDLESGAINVSEAAAR